MRVPAPAPQAPPDTDTFRALAETIGEDGAARVSATYGGRELHIPKRPKPGQQLTDLVGLAAAQRLAQRFGGSTLVIPISQGKRRRIIELSNAGRLSTAQIAAEVGCTERHVYNVRAEYREHGGFVMSPMQPDPNQHDLFVGDETAPAPPVSVPNEESQ